VSKKRTGRPCRRPFLLTLELEERDVEGVGARGDKDALGPEGRDAEEGHAANRRENEGRGTRKLFLFSGTPKTRLVPLSPLASATSGPLPCPPRPSTSTTSLRRRERERGRRSSAQHAHSPSQGLVPPPSTPIFPPRRRAVAMADGSRYLAFEPSNGTLVFRESARAGRRTRPGPPGASPRLERTRTMHSLTNHDPTPTPHRRPLHQLLQGRPRDDEPVAGPLRCLQGAWRERQGSSIDNPPTPTHSPSPTHSSTPFFRRPQVKTNKAERYIVTQHVGIIPPGATKAIRGSSTAVWPPSIITLNQNHSHPPRPPPPPHPPPQRPPPQSS
jgi:hypothetical protein